jgi:hypothetical protein
MIFVFLLMLGGLLHQVSTLGEHLTPADRG